MKSFEVVTFGSALKDIMFYSDEIEVLKNSKDVTKQKLMAVEYGAKMHINEVFVNYGGGALNVAVGLNNFGIRVAPMVNVGKDLVGKEIFSYLKGLGVKTSLMNVDHQRKTGFSLILTDKKTREHTIFTYKGASNFLEAKGLRNFRTKWMYLSSLNSHDWALQVDKIMRQTRRDVKIFWNPGSMQLEEHEKLVPFLPFVEILMLNKDEAIELVKNEKPRTTKAKLNDVKFLLNSIVKMGPQKIVITQGEKGVSAIDELGKYYYIPSQAVKKRIVDTVGAGDSFSSGLLAGMVRYEDFHRALKLAVKNSSFVLYRIGAQNGLLKIKL
jgi:sugar/nucleoside kinase (ribokinase family)